MLSARMPALTALQMLRAVHRLGSFSAAGHALGLSQQAVSSRMRALEESVGTPLLSRSPRGSTLTPTGTLIAEWADDVLDAAERLDAAIASVRHDTGRRLRVVASQTVAEHLVPGWLVTLRRREETGGEHPSAIDLSVTNSSVAAAMVRSGEANIGFIESPRIPHGLAHRRIRHDEMQVVVAPGHPWSRRRRPLSAEDLARTSLVTREVGSGTRDALEVILATQAPGVAQPMPVVELSTSAAVRSAIAAGTAPGVLSALAVRDDLTLGRLVAVPTEQPIVRPLTAIWQGSRTPPPGPARDLLAIAGATSPSPMRTSSSANLQ